MFSKTAISKIFATAAIALIVVVIVAILYQANLPSEPQTTPTPTPTSTPTPAPTATPTPTPIPTPTQTPNNAAQEAIDDVIPEIEPNISWFLSEMVDGLPRNPLNEAQIQEKINMLSEPDLAENIVNQGLFVVDFVLSIDGRNIPIVAVFPRDYMREDAANEVYRTKLAIPILENFFDIPLQRPLQRNWIHIWYGFIVGNMAGGGSVYAEDRPTYESRFREGMMPYDFGLYHELGHNYIAHESLTQFLEVYLYNLINTGSTNFEDWTNPRTPPEKWPWITAILDIYQLIGHDAMVEAYRVIYSYYPPYGMRLYQECKQAFVDQAPESLKSQVSELAEIIEY